MIQHQVLMKQPIQLIHNQQLKMYNAFTPVDLVLVIRLVNLIAIKIGAWDTVEDTNQVPTFSCTSAARCSSNVIHWHMKVTTCVRTTTTVLFKMTFMHRTITTVNQHDRHWIFQRSTKWDTWRQGDRKNINPSSILILNSIRLYF